MPRPRNSSLRILFETDNDNVWCKNGTCNGKLLNQHAGNLERHLRNVHPEIYELYLKKKDGSNKKCSGDTVKFTCTVKKKNIENAIVELFTKKGRSLHMAEDLPFKIIAKPVFDALNIKLNETNLMNRIIQFSSNLKEQVSKNLAGKLISLKIDAASRLNLSILAVNVQYINENGIVIKMLGIKELKQRHTSNNLKFLILNILKEYNISLNQILSITSGNGANMMKTVNNINDEISCEMKDDFDCETVFENNIFPADFTLDNVTSVRCGAHTLQLCVNDVFKERSIKEKLEKIRAIMKKLKTPTYINILKTGKYRKPILDCLTRWNSTYLMLERLTDLKKCITLLSSDNTSLQVSDEDWGFVSTFLNTFKSIYIASLKLQSENCIYSDLYIQILNITIQVGNLPDNVIKSCLIETLNKRKAMLIETDLFVAAVFLDPRIKVLLNSDQIAKAKAIVFQIHKRLLSLKENFAVRPSTSTLSMPPSTIPMPALSPKSTKPPSSVEDALENYLKNFERTAFDDNLPTPCIENDILLYEQQCRLGVNENIIEYWNKQNNELSVVAKAILGIPCTQVSMERVFSALKYILSEQCNNLNPSNLEHILLVRANGEFHYED